MYFNLSSKSLKQVKEAGFENDFYFKILNEKIPCTKFVASFFSSKISKEIRNDPTVDYFNVKFPSKSEFYSSIEELKQKIERANFINKFKDLIEGQPILIESKEILEQDQDKAIFTSNTETAQLIIIFGNSLGNDEMISEGLELLGLTINSDDSIDTCKKMIEINRVFGKYDKKWYDHIASQFYSIFQEDEEMKEYLKKMSKNELDIIFSSDKLKIESEDSLFELITSLGPNYYFLYDYIEFQYLSIESIQKLIENINNYEIQFHPRLWSSICRRLTKPIEKGSSMNPREAKYKGIIEFLSKSENENIFSAKKIDVSTSKVENDSNFKIENLFDRSKSTCFRLDNVENGHITIDLKSNKINLKKYYFSVPSHTYSDGQPKSWRIEGSNDKNSWDLIDLRENDSSLKGSGNSNTFECSHETKKFYRYICIKEIYSHTNDHKFLLSELDLIGFIQA